MKKKTDHRLTYNPPKKKLPGSIINHVDDQLEVIEKALVLGAKIYMIGDYTRRTDRTVMYQMLRNIFDTQAHNVWIVRNALRTYFDLPWTGGIDEPDLSDEGIAQAIGKQIKKQAKSLKAGEGLGQGQGEKVDPRGDSDSRDVGE
jgi:hypothetical protein